jgi:hypothetical protein
MNMIIANVSSIACENNNKRKTAIVNIEQTTGVKSTEEIEGLDTSDVDSWGNYPIDTVLIRNEPRTIHEILRRISQGTFIMDPEFQRDFLWTEDKQSKLIESVMMRIPLPVFYLAEDDQGRMIVVDGLQRLSTFERFIKNDLRLKLPEQKELDGKRFRDLPPKLQNRFEDCTLILYIIDNKVPEQARLDIFERVNSGVPLTRQQMRNSLMMGQATRFLKTEALTDSFRQATGGSLNPSTMRDREFVNRYCAFQLLGIDTYKGDMDDFLARTLREMNRLPEKGLENLSVQFRRSMANNLNVFGIHAFRKHIEGQTNRNVLNAALWDVLSTGLSRYLEDIVDANKDLLCQRVYLLMEDPDFVKAITYSTNSLSQVQYRFKVMTEVFREVLGD